MRVLVLVHEYPPIGGGGGKVAEDICVGLVARGHQVRVLTMHLKGLAPIETRDGVDLIRIRSGRRYAYKASFSSMFLYLLSGFLPGLKEIRTWKPDLIHVHFAVPAGALAWILSKLTGVPYVLTAHLGDVPGGVPEKTDRWFKWVRPFTPPIWRSASAVVAVSEFTKSLAEKKYPVSVEVIPNGIEVHRFDPGRISVHIPAKIVFAGRFVQQKNPLQIIQTLSRLKHLPWTCALLGDGPCRNEIEKSIQENDLADRIELPGWLTPDDVIDTFRNSDILFMPSLSEGLPVVGVQALAMGLAIVGSSSGFVDLIKPGENGYLFPANDTDHFASALGALVTDPIMLLKFRKYSRRLAANFDLQAILNRYEILLLGKARTS